MDFIGIDVGTSGCKAALLSESGTVKKSARREYGLNKHADGWASLSLSAVWKNVKEMLLELSPEAKQVRALAVSSLGETIVFLDERDRLLVDDGITYADSRNLELWGELKERVQRETLYELTGKTQPHIATINQYNYWMRRFPQLAEKTKRILFVDSFVAYMLCGEAGFDYSTASNTLFYDINTYQWSEKLVDAFDIDKSVFPKVAQAGTPLGRIRLKLSKELELPAELEILTGCHDQISAAIGGGVTEPGDAVLGEGTTETINYLANVKDLSRMRRAHLQLEPFIRRGEYLCLQSRLMHGSCIKWFAERYNFAQGDLRNRENGNIYDELNQNCARKSYGIIFLPWFSATYFPDISSPMGAFIGMDTSATLHEMYRAMLEGLSCETLEMLKQLTFCGLTLKQVTATGGASRSSVYMQIKADITGQKISTLQNAEAGLCGLVALCAVQMGCYGNLKEATEGIVRYGEKFSPKKDQQEVVERYRLISSAVRQAYQNLERA